MSLSESYSRPRPSGGIELWSWLFMRLSGVALLLLAVGHMVIMHLINNVDQMNYAFVAARWQSWFWRGYDLLLLTLAMIHGVAGMRVICTDYIHEPGRLRAALGAIYLFCGGLMALGLYVAIFFQPVVR